jgi:hypothetical protein
MIDAVEVIPSDYPIGTTTLLYEYRQLERSKVAVGN